MMPAVKTLWQIVATATIGLRITIRHLFRTPVTEQYPVVRPRLPERTRHQLINVVAECIGCAKCASACPVDCIYIDTVKLLPDESLPDTANGNKRRLWLERFDIDMAKCCFCGDCTHPCPTGSIRMTDTFDFAQYNRADLLFSFNNITKAEAEAKRAEHERIAEEKKAQKAAEAAAKAKAAAPPEAPAE